MSRANLSRGELIIVFLVFEIIFAMLFLFYFSLSILLRIGWRILKHHSNDNLDFVSVIVATKNEACNVRRCLDSLVNQDYPKDLLEIIISDDGSTDNTLSILDEYNNKFSFVSYLKNGNYKSGKKQALARAIEKSKGEILLFTDADCAPQEKWIRLMNSYFDSKIGVVVGFSPLVDPTNSLLGNIIQLDSLAAGIVAAGSIGLNKAVTCTGRNLAYRREVFNQLNGYEKIMNRISGDDDLFLQMVKYETNWEIRYSTEIQTVVPSFQTKSFTEFFRQKRRHLSAGKSYNLKVQIGYFLFHLANLCFYLFVLFSILTGKYLFISLGLFVSKIFADWFLLTTGCSKFSLIFSTKDFLSWEVFFLFYHLIIGPVSWFGKIRW
jgi:cellulose synthase/poly-beta-1,6-N-acetylglucosamine synthase-like glycosyltransferase